MPALRNAPVTFMAARDNYNVDETVDVALSLFDQARTRVTTATLNNALQAILDERGPSAKRGTKPVRVYYATQVATAPPTIVFFCNSPSSVTDNYRRFMENRLRDLTPFSEVPMRLWFRPRREQRNTSR